MDIFWRLVFAHLLADFTFQTNRIAKWKRETIWGIVAHSAIFTLVGLIVCLGKLTDPWVWITPYFCIPGWGCIIILSILHFLEDQWRIYSINKFGSPDNIFFFLWDQIVHISLIFVFSPVDQKYWIDKIMLIGTLAVIATHFATILIYYLEKMFNSNAQIVNQRKYDTIVARLLLMVCCLIPWGLWWLIIVLLTVGIFIYQTKYKKFIWLDTILGNLISIACGILARIIYFS